MATATTLLIERQALAELNTLRVGPGWIRLASHLLTIVLGGVLWRLESLPLALRLAGLVISGIFLAGYPNMNGMAPISFFGQLGGAVVMAALGFIPGYVISYALNKAGLLRVPAHAEERGLDLTEVPAQAYPEWSSMYGQSSSVGGEQPSVLLNAEPKSV